MIHMVGAFLSGVVFIAFIVLCIAMPQLFFAMVAFTVALAALTLE